MRLKKLAIATALFLAVGIFWGETLTAQNVTVPTVRVGTDRIVESEFLGLLKGKRIGVLAHHASRNASGEHLVDVLAGNSEINLRMIFAPEHGYRSTDDSLLPDSVDAATGLPVYSLYGPRRFPTPEMLSLLDTVVIDLQDVGVRYYTYAATMVYTMRAAQRAGKEVIVLDRPNPVGGVIVEGTVLEEALSTGGLTNIAPISTRHAMTLGELAKMFNQTLQIGVNLTVVPMKGWTREMHWEETGLTWTAPSPALIAADQSILYAVFGTLESANLAVGRGQENRLAFRNFGAPWIKPEGAEKLAIELQKLELPGLHFRAIAWTPDRAVFMGRLCHGFRVEVTDRSKIEGFRSLLMVLRAMKQVLGADLNLTGTTMMLGAKWLQQGVETATPIDALIDRARRESELFLRQREQALLY